MFADFCRYHIRKVRDTQSVDHGMVISLRRRPDCCTADARVFPNLESHEIAFHGALRSAVFGLLACIAVSTFLQHLRPPTKNFAHRNGAPSPNKQLLQAFIAWRAAAALLLNCFVCV
jgi:hypothetical protein